MSKSIAIIIAGVAMAMIVFPPQSFAQTEIYVPACDMRIKLSDSLAQKTVVRKIDDVLVQSFLPFPPTISRLSKTCEFDVEDEKLYNSKKGITVSFSYQHTPYRPRICSWDTAEKKWKTHPTTMNRKLFSASAELTAVKQILSICADTRDTYSGSASWYRHVRYTHGSATNIFPIGTKLKVTNTLNSKQVLVTVTSTWTNSDKKRIIDLVKTAFEKIANPRVGLIPVTIERISKK